ncbi:MAG: hypothetical protein Q8L11_04510 [Candidatus Moranbacteria bacterium]|nr:hypothetical protein [Candidatus Moranbacteria bacterium]
MLKRKIAGLAIVLLAMSGSGFILYERGFTQESGVALADDEDGDDEEYDDDQSRIINTDPEDEKIEKTETKTVYTKLSDTVTQTTVTVIRHDSDGDGTYDDEDEHPAINENFIVKDADNNGIDDKYEQ